MGRGDAPAKEISFVSLMAYGPKVSDTVLAMGGLQLLKPGRAVPNKRLVLSFAFCRQENRHKERLSNLSKAR